MRRAWQTLWSAPRAPHARGPLARDWALVALVVTAALLEGILRPDVVWRPAITVVVVAAALTLPWRRVHPLLMLALALGGVTALQVASIAVNSGAVVTLATGAFVLVLVYSAFRWGSGKEAVGAIAVLLLAVAIGFGRDYSSVSELLLEVTVIALPAVAAIAVRTQVTSRTRALEQVRLAEREQLARELHDTVAHHVTAMVVRAQAGRVVGVSDPAAALDSLAVIEAEGARTLAEMRVLVGALRDSDDPALLAPRTVSDIATLADTSASGPAVTVTMTGDVDDVHPSVGATLYRVAQESVTNARRHAVGAQVIAIAVVSDTDAVHLTVADDGEPVTHEPSGPGYGIVGMSERLALLGGTLAAGPGPDRGWVVDARVPRTGVRT